MSTATSCNNVPSSQCDRSLLCLPRASIGSDECHRHRQLCRATRLHHPQTEGEPIHRATLYANLPRRRVPTTVGDSADKSHPQGRAECSGGARGVQRRTEVGEIRRGQSIPKDGAYFVCGSLSVFNTKVFVSFTTACCTIHHH